ncbi:MAG: metallopeptidase TldD-related protein, partial [archaeon]
FAEPAKGKQKKPVFDKKIMELDEEKAIQSAYDCLGGAISELERKKIGGHLNITGEIDYIAERMAVKNSNGINASDQGTIALATLTTILEQRPDLSGMWFDSSTKLEKLDAAKAGKTSAQKALDMQSPQKIDSGEYSVVFGRVAVAELLYSRFDVGLNAIDLNASPYINRLDSMVASEKLSIADDGAFEGAIGTKTVTDEGLPTGKTKIVEKGKLVNFLANDYYAKKFGDKRFSARNGFRTGGGGRHHDSRPSISATNLVVSKGEFSDEELLKEIKNGVYIGRIWYTYPVNGLASADFTSTVRGDSYIIENGKIKSALVPNTVRVNENLDRVFQNILGISKKQQATLAWGQEAVVITPEIAVKGVRLERIAKDIY